MVIEFTDAEKQQLMDIDKHYADQLDAIDAKIRQEREGTSTYNNLVVDHIELEDARENDFSALYEQFEKVRFDQLGGDPAAILANGKEQTELILKNEYEGRKQYDIDLSGKPKSADPKIESSDAVKLIKCGVSLHLNALKGKPEGAKLRNYIYSYVSRSPYTYTANVSQKAKKETKELPVEVKDLFHEKYITALGGELTNVLYDLSIHSFRIDEFTNRGTFKVKGIEVSIEGIDSFTGEMSTSTLKLWDAITAYLALNNPYGIKSGINTNIEIPLQEYAEARDISIKPKKENNSADQKKEDRRAQKRKRNFKDDIKRDLDRLAKFRLTGKVAKGKTAGDYNNLVLIYPDHSIEGDIIKINMPEDTATYLLNAYPMNYAPELQKVSDTNPNVYRIGRKMLSYSSIDSNARRGTNTTLKVKTIASFSRYIPTLQQLESRGQRNWKEKIKKPLETVFKRLEEAGILLKWQYESPRTQEKITPKAVESLTGNEYMNLNVQFKLKENKKQIERTLKQLEEKEEKQKEQQKNVSTEVGTNGTPR